MVYYEDRYSVSQVESGVRKKKEKKTLSLTSYQIYREVDLQ